jgi:hypothetical protein
MASASQLVFGTMRMLEVERSVDDWIEFFAQLHARGITRIHSSSEYDSFPLFAEVMRTAALRYPDVRFRHIVKLAEPSFDETGFAFGRLQQRLDGYRLALEVEKIDDIQWMWRANLKEEAARLADFSASLPAIDDAIVALKDDSSITAFYCFPYTTAFAEQVLQSRQIDGLTIYRNMREHDYDYLLDRCHAEGKTCLAIRPFAAGAALSTDGPDAAARFDASVDHPAIEGAILSTSKLPHIDALVAA